MTRYLFDTNHASAVMRGEPLMLARIQAARRAEYCLCLPSIGELWFMVFNSTQVDENRRELERLIRRCAYYEFDFDAAIEFGQVQTELRKRGRPIPSIDIQIAAIARANGLVLLTDDRHFGEVHGIDVENWLKLDE